MLRKVLEEYRDGFRWSRFKETYHYTMLWYYLYLFCFFPIILNINEETVKLGAYYLTMLPVMLGMYTVAAIPIRLPKQMFLCPMTQAERKKYVTMLFGVRYLGTVIPGTIAYIIAVACKMIPTVFLLIQLLGLYTCVFCASITTWPGSTWERNEKEKVRLKNPKLKGLYPKSIIGLIMGMLLQMLEPFGLFEGKSKGAWIFLGSCCVVVVVLSILVARYLSTVLEMTINYEYSYDVARVDGKKGIMGE